MARAAIRQIVFTVAAASLLMGCVEGAGGSAVSGDAASSAPASRRSGNQDIEAPEVFQVTDTALWDGRPSLGGIWVASPDTVDPERVVMVNTANGQTVTGALFRRERDNPGPALQISSDAADALGILAGQPVEIRVTALRKAQAAEPALAETAPETPPEDETAGATEGESPQTTTDAPTDGATDDPADATAIATAALAAVEAGTEATGAAGDAVVPAPEATSPPKKKTWKERRAEAKAEREAAKAAKAAKAAGAAVAADPAAGSSDVAASDTVVVTPVETAPLDARSTEVAEGAAAATIGDAAPVPEKRKTRRQIKAEQEAAAAAAAEAAAATPTEAPVATVNARPIQVASFSREENANRAVEALAKTGVSASARKGENGGKVVWGVVAMGDEALLQSIKKAGFADAFFLK